MKVPIGGPVTTMLSVLDNGLAITRLMLEKAPAEEVAAIVSRHNRFMDRVEKFFDVVEKMFARGDEPAKEG